MEIASKVAIVTGGASGLGRATVERFAAQGAKVAIFDMNAAAGSAIASELGDSVIYENVNVTEAASVQAGIDHVIEVFGAIHICCNFAGIGSASKTLGKQGVHPLADFNAVIQVNLIGTFNVLRLAAEQMANNDPLNEDGARGVIINTASVAAFEGQVGQAAYSASKGGIVGMTLPIARDLAPYGIRVNTIAPGLIHTPLLAQVGEEMYQSLEQQVVFPKRLGKAAEIAQLAASIVENDYMNGECIRLDGAIRMQPR